MTCCTFVRDGFRFRFETPQVGLDEPRFMGLDDSLEYINDDEQVEVRILQRLRLLLCCCFVQQVEVVGQSLLLPCAVSRCHGNLVAIGAARGASACEWHRRLP